jgi:hypothetical protein
MWYRDTLDMVRLRHTLRGLLTTPEPRNRVDEALERLRLMATEHPMASEELRQEYERWKIRFDALGATSY